MTAPPAGSESHTPRTEFGKTLWALHQAAVAAAQQRVSRCWARKHPARSWKDESPPAR